MTQYESKESRMSAQMLSLSLDYGSKTKSTTKSPSVALERNVNARAMKGERVSMEKLLRLLGQDSTTDSKMMSKSSFCNTAYWARARDMPAMIRYLDQWATKALEREGEKERRHTRDRWDYC
ncbi:hypothetical protein TNCV_2339761 [Trichonephila clavipes]|nr:hypothetical protein TNCV_2339761 [Trichonephila clavipes]